MEYKYSGFNERDPKLEYMMRGGCTGCRGEYGVNLRESGLYVMKICRRVFSQLEIYTDAIVLME